MGPSNIKNIKILLVEDQKIILTIHQKMLEDLGYTPDIAVSGEEAIAKAANGYDVIFMDIGLPGISGIEAAAKIRLQENNQKRTYIVALTAYIADEVQINCQRVGIDVVKGKPIFANEIKELLSLFQYE